MAKNILGLGEIFILQNFVTFKPKFFVCFPFIYKILNFLKMKNIFFVWFIWNINAMSGYFKPILINENFQKRFEEWHWKNISLPKISISKRLIWPKSERSVDLLIAQVITRFNSRLNDVSLSYLILCFSFSWWMLEPSKIRTNY
jgi:hypothetical protein